MTTHICPAEGSGLTPCCHRTPFELPAGDRMSIYTEEVDCIVPNLEPSPPTPFEYVLRFNLREVKKMEYLANKQRNTQEKRNRPGDVALLEDILDKLQRARFGL